MVQRVIGEEKVGERISKWVYIYTLENRRLVSARRI